MRATRKVIVVDLECTCWDDPSRRRDMEIIEIGLCLFDGLTGEIGRRSSIIVRPVVLDVSDRCTRLTGLTEERLRSEGIPLAEALSRVRKAYPLRSAAWAGWGQGDQLLMLRETTAKGIPYPFGDTYLNLGHLFGLHSRATRRMGLSDALAQLGMEFEGSPHSGVDDAWNAARILKALLGWK